MQLKFQNLDFIYLFRVLLFFQYKLFQNEYDYNKMRVQYISPIIQTFPIFLLIFLLKYVLYFSFSAN